MSGKGQNLEETRTYHSPEEEHLYTMDRDEYDSYRGEWIAIVDKEVVAHGVSFLEVAREATRKANGKAPLLERILRHDENKIYIM